MTDRITQTHTHTYGPDGLLKESKETDSFFLKKGTGVMVSYIIKRPYDDSRNLIKERKFATDPQKLMHEKIIQYDKNNNMILSIEKWENVVWFVTKKIFNDKNQLTKQIEITQEAKDQFMILSRLNIFMTRMVTDTYKELSSIFQGTVKRFNKKGRHNN